MPRMLMAMLLGWAVALLPAATTAQEPFDPSQPPPSLSQIIRQAGYSLGDAEAAYLDAEMDVQGRWIGPLIQVVSLAGPDAGLPAGETRPAIEAELRTLATLDAAAGPDAPPGFQRQRELAVLQRQAVQRAAQQWLAALQAGDADWRQRGGDEMTTAQQYLTDWQQELAGRYPPPEPPQ